MRTFIRHIRNGRPYRRFIGNRTAVIASIFLFALFVVAVVGLFATPQDPDIQSLSEQFQPPSRDHLLGTDAFGRDILSRLIVATRVTLVAAVQGLGLAIVLGVPAGLFSGYIGGGVDAFLGRVTDAALALPPLILALAIVGILGPGLTNAMIAIGIVMSPRFFRIARVASQGIGQEGYIEAARADGCTPWRILGRHVLPNASGPLLVQASFGIGLVITSEASLSFLGLGVQPPTPSLGSMIRDGFQAIQVHPYPAWPPSMLVVLIILAFFLVGDGLRDALGRGGAVGK